MVINIQMQYFDAIKSGRKTVEGRLWKDDYRSLQPGDPLIFVCGDDKLCRIAKSLHIYANFRQMLENEGALNCLPDIPWIDECVKLYESFPGYKERQIECGVLAIRLG